MVYGWYVCVSITAGGLWGDVVMLLYSWGKLSSSCVAIGFLESIPCGEVWLCAALCVWVGAGGHLAPPAFTLQCLLSVALLCVPRRAPWSWDREFVSDWFPCGCDGASVSLPPQV